MDNNNPAEDHFVDAEVIDPVVLSESDPQLSSAGPPEYVNSADLKGQKEKEAHLVGQEWKDRKKDSKKQLDKLGQQQQKKDRDNDDDDNGDAGGINGMQSTVIISVAVVAVVGVLLAVTRKFCVR